jgi:hypothetical protein
MRRKIMDEHRSWIGQVCCRAGDGLNGKKEQGGARSEKSICNAGRHPQASTSPVYPSSWLLSNQKKPRQPAGLFVALYRLHSSARYVLRLGTFGTLDDGERYRITLGQSLEAIHLDGGEVNEHIRTSILLDETESFGIIEPLDLALRHCLPLLLKKALPCPRSMP